MIEHLTLSFHVPSDPPQHQLTWYNLSNALWMGSFSIQQLLVTWILVGILHEPPEVVGIAQLIIGIPGLAFMLWGGVMGDRVDGRRLLIQSHLLSIVPPLVLAAGVFVDALGFWILILTALAANLLNSVSNPARNTILNQIAGQKLQIAISVSTGIGSIATMAGTRLAGEIDRFGLINILLVQSVLFAIGALCLLGLRAASQPVPSQTPSGSESAQSSMIQTIQDGLIYAWRFKLARDIIGMNFVSSFFNAGAWFVAVPFIVNRIYAGDALLLANISVVFYFGSLLANFGLVKFMPIRFSGRLYLIMQLTRLLVLSLIWIEPPIFWFWIAAAYWGFNMGVTTTMSRVIVQEVAEPQYRSRLMSVFTLALMSSTPIGSLVLGFVISAFGELNALIPGMVVSILIFGFGLRYSPLWHYKSPQPGKVTTQG